MGQMSVQAHQCYFKCAGGGDGEHCDGFFSGFDTSTSNALCLTSDKCKALCEGIPECHSYDMHNTLPRCFLNTKPCTLANIDHPWIKADDAYTLNFKKVDPAQDRRLAGAVAKELTWGFSWSQML